MNKIICDFIFIALVGSVSSFSNASESEMSCGEFSGLSGVSTVDEYINSKPTREQFDAFKKVISAHVRRLSLSSPLTNQASALKAALKDEQVKKFLISNSFEMTVASCAEKKDFFMRDVAIEQFDYLFESVTKK